MSRIEILILVVTFLSYTIDIYQYIEYIDDVPPNSTGSSTT